MQQVVFRLLGPPEIRYKEQLIKIPRRRSRALLYYLACTQTPQPRERLLALLCGDVDEESARHTFKTLLAEVRALLRSLDAAVDWIISDDNQLRLNPLAPLWLDTEIFERGTAVTSRYLHRTLALYRGDFLDGFFLRDAPGFETWVRSTRDHFRHIYLSTLHRLAELYEADNQLDQAITCTQMLLTTDPLMEDAYANLMRLYWLAGRRIEALRAYEQLCEVLARELAVKPSTSTQSLYEQIARSSRLLPSRSAESPTPVPEEAERVPSPAPAPKNAVAPLSTLPRFVGRAAELAWLKNHLSAAADAGPLILLAGEAGIGKTRLLQETLADMGAPWLLLRGTCREVERAHAYHAVVEALRAGLTEEEVTRLNLPGTWRAQLARLLPDMFPSISTTLDNTSTQPLALAEALGAVFNQLASPQRPLLLLLDDLHWADEATLALLGYLARVARRGCVFLLGAFCTSFEQARLAPLRRSAARQNGLAELLLPPLSAEEVARLVSHFPDDKQTAPDLATGHSALANWCYQHSEGNPFFALAWLDQARSGAASAHSLFPLAIPEPIVALVQTQLDFLSQEARVLLIAAAFADSPFDPIMASISIDIDKKTCLSACLGLVRAGLIVEASPGLYAFAHSSVREVLRTAGGPLQRHLSRQAGQSL